MIDTFPLHDPKDVVHLMGKKTEHEENQAAERRSKTIMKVWADMGHTVHASPRKVPRLMELCVRSDMINGLPRSLYIERLKARNAA